MKKIIYIFTMIMLSTLALAYQYPSSTNPDLMRYVYQFNDSSQDDIQGIYIINTGSVANTTGIWGDAINYSAASVYGYNNTENYNSTFWVNATICSWISPNSLLNGGRFMVFYYDTNNRFGVMPTSTSLFWRIYLKTNANPASPCDLSDSRAIVNVSKWQHVCIQADNTNVSLYVNGQKRNSSACAYGFDDFAGKPGLYLGDSNIGVLSGSTSPAAFDELLIVNRTLSDSQIWDIYNGNVSLPPPPGSISVALNTPVNNSGESSNYINFSYNITYYNINVTNCSLFINSSTGWLPNATNTSSVSNNSFNYFNNIFLDANTYKWNVVCCNQTTCFSDANNRTLYIDVISPSINSTFINNTVYYYASNLSAYVNFSDDISLWSYNISIDGILLKSNTSISSKTQDVYFTSNLSAFPGGLHNYTERVADGHTAKTLKNSNDYNPSKCLTGNCLKFNFGGVYKRNTITIQQKDKSLYDAWDYTKQIDKYSFSFIPYQKKQKYTFEIISDTKLYVIDAPNTPYKKWIVSEDEHWIDLNPYTIDDIKKINDKLYEIILSSDDSILRFNSIGDLNVLTKTYSFYTTNASLSYSSDVIETATQTIGVNISKIAGMNTTANFSYKGAAYTPVKSSSSDYDYYYYTFSTPNATNTTDVNIFYYNFSIISTTTTLGNITANQTVHQIHLDNCSNYTTVALNFTYQDEVNYSYVEADISGTFLYSYQGNTYKSYVLSENDASYTEICIDPSFAALLSNYSFIYSNSNYPQRRYYANTQTLSNSTVTIPLFMLTTSSGLYGRFQIIDGLSNPLKGVTGTMKKYVVSSWYTSEIELSDDAGAMAFWLDPNTDYQFTFTKEGYTPVTETLRITSGDVTTIVMSGSSSTAINYSYAEGISYYFLPYSTLMNNTLYTFSFNMTSSLWTITDCNLYLYDNASNLLGSCSSFTGTNCYCTIPYNTGVLTGLRSTAVYNLNGSSDLTVYQLYTVRYNYQGNFSLQTVVDDINKFSLSGFNATTRFFLGFIVIFVSIAFISYKFEVTDEAVLVGIFILMTVGISSFGWFYIDIPHAFDFIKYYFVALLVFFIGMAIIIKKLKGD